MTREMALENQPQQPKKTCKSLEDVPTDIIILIFFKLPVDSLVRCRYVCKLWFSSISDPYFVKSHLKILSNNSNKKHRLIFTTWQQENDLRRRYLKSCHLYDVLFDQSLNNTFDLDYPLKEPYTYVSIVGNCNGLLCIRAGCDTLCIWNPSTRRSSKRFSPYYDYKVPSHRYVVYGFGYDDSTDDYKLAELSCLSKYGYKSDTLETNIYSLKSGNWKTIDDIPHRVPSGNSGKFLNGAIHWGAHIKIGSSYWWTIVSLDLAKETYGEILLPVYDEGYKSLTLGTLGEWLCVLCSYHVSYREYQANVWVMKVYGVIDSWTKLISIPYPTDPGRVLSDRFSVPLCILNDGKVLLQLASKLFLYDSKSVSFSEIQNFDKWHDVYTFVESLVSPDAPAGSENNNDDVN